MEIEGLSQRDQQQLDRGLRQLQERKGSLGWELSVGLLLLVSAWWSTQQNHNHLIGRFHSLQAKYNHQIDALAERTQTAPCEQRVKLWREAYAGDARDTFPAIAHEFIAVDQANKWTTHMAIVVVLGLLSWMKRKVGRSDRRCGLVWQQLKRTEDVRR